MAFRFRLGTILRYRERTEDIRAQALARAIERREAAARRLTLRRADAQAGRAALAHALHQGTDGLEIRALGAAAEVLARRVLRGSDGLAAAEDEVRTARAALLRATRDRRALDHLEGLARAAYAQARDRAEARALDDLALAAGQPWSGP